MREGFLRTRNSKIKETKDPTILNVGVTKSYAQTQPPINHFCPSLTVICHYCVFLNVMKQLQIILDHIWQVIISYHELSLIIIDHRVKHLQTLKTFLQDQ